MTDELVLVTGGTGKTGRRVAAQLQARGVPTRVVSRSSDIRLDWDDPDTWDAALDGVTMAYLAPNEGNIAVADFARRAADRGVQRVVLLSARGMTTPGYYDGEEVLTPQFVTGEEGVRSSGLAWSIIRPGWFSQNFSEGEFLQPILDGRLSLPTDDGAAAFIDADDIAAVAVSLLVDGGHDGEAFELTGPAPTTIADAVAMIAEATGRDIRYEPISAEEYERRLVAAGTSERDAHVSAVSLSPIRMNREAAVSDGVPQVLGRPARSFETFVQDAAAAGAWS